MVQEPHRVATFQKSKKNAAMGLEKIDFIWYLKHISWLAVIGYFFWCALYLLGTVVEFVSVLYYIVIQRLP